MDNISGSISPRGIRVSGIISQKVLRGLSAYQVAVQNGFQGTQAEFLQSLRGENIEFKAEGLRIYYKYESDEEWTLLVQIDQLLADYLFLDNKPKINNVELIGNKTLDDLGIQPRGNYVESQTGYSLVSDTEIERLSHVDNYDDSAIRATIQEIILAAVTGVKGDAESTYRKGNVNITPENIGLGNVDNTADEDKNVYSSVRDSDGNIIYETYFSGISTSNGEVFLVRPDGSSQKLMNSSHNHDASQITSGTLDIARLPAGALERLVDVADRTARYALTRETVQNGDTVRQLDTGVMYRVVDDTQLNRSTGYKEYTAGRASAVPWSGVEDKPLTFTPSSHTHEISQITDIANASVAQAAKLKTPRSFVVSGGAVSSGVQFDGTGNVTLQIYSLDSSYLSGTAYIDITGNAATATRFARERTIEVTGKATAAPKVYDGRQNIALEVTALDAADKVHTHTMSQIVDLTLPDPETIANFSTSNSDNFSDIWFSDPLLSNKPVHNSGIQYNPIRDTLKAGKFQGRLIGNADTATALTTNAGSETQPVYFDAGRPVATTYSLNATVPADAVFTDTHYASTVVVAGSFNGKVNTSTALTNGNVYINHVENNTVTASHKISGTGSTAVLSDEYGNIIIDATMNGYSQGSGISISNSVISNSGVRAVSESTEDGHITVNTNGTASNVPVHGLGTAAYTDSTSYATSTHKHSFSDLQNKPTTIQGYGITDAVSANHEHDASEITSGVIDIARLPAGALERLIVVANQAARFALTKSSVQNGDTVQQEDTGIMYRVVDDNNLNNSLGYKEYTAGAASSVPWSGVTGKPDSFVPATHSHSVSDIENIATATVAKAGQLTTERTISLTGAVTGSGEFDGSSNLVINTSANHTHQYAGSQTIGGPANSAVKLETSSAGSSVVPVYFYEGKPVAMSYQLNTSVPADAVFTDTHYSSTTVINSAQDSTTNSSRSISNGNVFLNHVENGTVRSSHRIIGSGVVTVTYNTDGDLVINGIGVDPQFMPTLYSLSINGVMYDGSQAVDVGIIDVAHGGTGSSSVDSSPTVESSRMVTSGGVYTALLGKSDLNHTHNYAGSSSAGGSATSAEALTSNAGNSTQPIYFSSGKPTATTYALNATVPADAVFTDTHHQSSTVVAGSSSATSDTSSTVSNGSVYINHIENGAVRSSHRITGTGSATVTTDTSGNIVVNAEDTKYTTLPNPNALSINGQSYDGTSQVTVGVLGVAYGGTGNTSVDTAPTENSTKMVTSGGLYTALAGKADLSHTHTYAGSSSAGGSATSAVKLDSDAGSATQPIFFSSGKPTACTYALNKTVPADALFTDTHYASKTVVGSANDVIVDTSSSLTNSHVFLNHVENGVVTSSHRISGTGATTVTTDSSGNILINSSDTKPTELPNPFSLTIQANGTSLGSYDGSEAKSFNLTYSNVGAAAASHSHTWSDLSNTPTTLSGYGITDQLAAKTHIHDASEIQSGVLDIARIPVAALERLIVVDDLDEMYALTTNDVQVGDTVQCENTGIMYRVVDSTNLDNAAGYKEYTAGVAASVPWSGVTDKPSSYNPSPHTHMYAGSSTVGGSATSAVKLDSNAGSSTNPVFFSGGKPTACTYELNATVPADAVFTDSHYEAKNIVGSSSSSTSDTSESLTNTHVFLNLVENSTVRSSHRISGSGATSVTTDTSGNIIITSADSKPSAGAGIDVSNSYVVTNTGVRAVSIGTSNGAISVDTNGIVEDVYVNGIGSAAFQDDTYFATALHTHSLSLSLDTGLSSVQLLPATKYRLTAGGSYFIFTTPADVKPSAGAGIDVTASGEISNTGVRSVSTGATNGTISVNTNGTSTEVSVYGLGSAAYTSSSDYATSGHTHSYAGSSTIGGAATTAQKATKLQTAREIKVDLTSIFDSSTNHPAFDGQANFTIPITGTLGVENGGTGKTTHATYGVLYGMGTSGIEATAAGSAGFVLSANGANTAPSWIDPSTLTVGKASSLSTARSLVVGLDNVYSSSSPITFDGSKNLDGSSNDNKSLPITGTLNVGHGGTGATTFSANGVLYGAGTDAICSTVAGSAGQLLKANGANAAPSWINPSDVSVGAAEKLSAAKTITLAVASGANGGVTGTVTTSFNTDVTIDTELSAHTHEASDITSGVLAVAQGGTGYNSIDATPTSGSDRVVKSSGVHKRIAYKKVTLSTSGWSNKYTDTKTSQTFYRQAISMGNDITASTQIVSIKLAGSMVDEYTTYSYTENFTGDGSTKEFTLQRVPSSITSITRGGAAVAEGTYTLSGSKVTLSEAPNTGVSVVISYERTYNNNTEFAKLTQAETGASTLEFWAYSDPKIEMTLVVGYVSETLDVISTQGTLLTLDSTRYQEEQSS